MSALTKPFAPETTDHARHLLLGVFKEGYEPRDDPFFRKYISHSSMPITLSSGVTVTIGVSRELIAIVLSMMYQKLKEYDEALTPLNKLTNYSFATTVIKAELNLLAKHNEGVLKLTDGITNEDDASMLALIYRAMALGRLTYYDGAMASLKEALRFRSRATELRHMALYERAQLLIRQKKFASAKKDLEKVMAEDAEYRSVAALLRKL